MSIFNTVKRMSEWEKAEKFSGFIGKLRKNRLSNPNEFTIGMGELIRKAREERGYSQAEFARETNRRPATISYIENGKSDISVLTLLLFAITLKKPISYFFPEFLLKSEFLDVKSEFEHQMLEYARGIEFFGDMPLALAIVRELYEHDQKEFDENERG
jgi:transcriptional regulator with XRE-family HTH domain